MKVGTKSVLFGAHCFFLHPLFVAWGWWKLYGFPWKPWLWVAFFVHDIGYWGSPNMDGPEGEEHPWVGAEFLYWLQRVWLLLKQPVFYRRDYALSSVRWWNISRRWGEAYFALSWEKASKYGLWGNVSLYHSRFLSKRYETEPSPLCWADKLAFALTPWWLYLPMTLMTGEIYEYQQVAKHEKDNMWVGKTKTWAEHRRWHEHLRQHILRVVEEKRVAP